MRVRALLTGIVGLWGLCATLAVSGCGGGDGAGSGRPVEGGNPYPPVPRGTGGNFNSNKNLALLTSRAPSGSVTPAPWAGYWWPYATNGIAASADKYDSVNRASAGAFERARHGLGLGDVAGWWGHCNGWAAAAMLAREPKGAVSVGGVRFDIRDRKALLSEVFMEVTGDFLGTRVDNPDDQGSAAFLDLVPAQFHLLFVNVMGIQKRAFIVDRYTGNQVWNHPVVAYATAPIRVEDDLGPDPRFPNVHRVNVTTKFWFSDDNVDPGVTTPDFDPANPSPVFLSRTLKYELWLDAPPRFDGSGNLVSSGDVILANDSGRAVGGVWKNSSLALVNSHPDYAWIPTGPAPSSGFKNPRISDDWVLSNLE